MAGANPALELSKNNFDIYQGKWVAAFGWGNDINNIVASGNSYSDAKKKAERRGVENPVIFFVSKDEGS
ncbi:MAG: DUF5678 domain-containing protein [Candidatus Paceibacterota bacterium]